MTADDLKTCIKSMMVRRRYYCGLVILKINKNAHTHLNAMKVTLVSGLVMRYLDVMTEVEAMEDLRQKHIDGGMYSEEQLRSWAHLIQMKKHASYETPPNKESSQQKRNQVTLIKVMILR